MGSSTKEAREREARVGMSGCVAGRIINDGEGEDIFMFSISWGGGGGGKGFLGKTINAEVRRLTLVTRVTR